MRSFLQRSLCLAVTFLLAATVPSRAEDVATLPDAKSLDWQGDLSVRMMDGMHRFIERKIDESIAKRPQFWNRDLSSPEAYEKSIAPNRERLKRVLGVVDPRVPVRMERWGDDTNPALVARTNRYSVYQVRWPVLDGVWGEGLLLEPVGRPVAFVIAIPDADQTPEQLVGLSPGVAAESQFARRLAEAGIEVVVPVLLDRTDRWSGNPAIAITNQTHREWIYRQAYHMGRHVIGYEIQKVLAAVDWFEQQAKRWTASVSPVTPRSAPAGTAERLFQIYGGPRPPVGVVGYSEGGLLAFYAAACDPRIDACMVSGYFQSRQRLWTEPLYRNVWSLLKEFGDAEIATLVAPRAGGRAQRGDGRAGATAGRCGPSQVGRRRLDQHARGRGGSQRVSSHRRAAAARFSSPAFGYRCRQRPGGRRFGCGDRKVRATLGNCVASGGCDGTDPGPAQGFRSGRATAPPG